MRTANQRQDPNSCIHYDVIWRYYSSTSTGERHQVMQEQTGSEPPNRCRPDLLVNTYSGVHHTFTQGVSSAASDVYKRQVYVPGTYISPFVVALVAGVNSNSSSRDVLLEDGKSETGPKQFHRLRRNLTSLQQYIYRRTTPSHAATNRI